jgi:DNA-binding MarR family transcriptional regulator
MDRALDDEALTPAAYRLLVYLTTGTSAAAVLAAKLAISRPSVTATIDWLESRGYVVRTPDPTDGRRSVVEITAEGQAALDRSDDKLVRRLSELLTLLEPAQAANLVETLELVTEALDRDRDVRDLRVFGTDRP